MKIRIYTPFFPFPVTEGAFQIIADQIQTFYNLGHWIEVVLILDTVSDVNKKIELLRSQKEFEIHHPIIQPSENLHFRFLQKNTKQCPSFSRLFRVLSSLPCSLASPELYYYPPKLKPRHCFETVDWAIYHYSFAYAWLKRNPPQGEKKTAVYFHNLESDLSSLYTLDTLPPTLPIISAHLDTSALSNKCVEATTHRLKSWIHRVNAKKLKRHEMALKELCDEIWMISPKDYETYCDRLSLANPDARQDPYHPLQQPHQQPHKMIRVTPPTYSKSLRTFRNKLFQQHIPAQQHSNSPVILGFIGGLDFGPNFDSAHWILTHLAPTLQQHGFSGKILFAGKHPASQLIKIAEAFCFVQFLGFVENIETFWSQLSFMLVPHISGSGVRIKLLEAVASGIPVLANLAAIERTQIDVQHSPLVKLCHNLEDWVNCILKEKNFHTRKKLLNCPLPASMDGEKIYAFLNN